MNVPYVENCLCLSITYSFDMKSLLLSLTPEMCDAAVATFATSTVGRGSSSSCGGNSFHVCIWPLPNRMNITAGAMYITALMAKMMFH